MKVVHVPCGPAVNESERKALERIKARLRSEPGGDEWLLLTNLAFSATPLRQSEEIDIVAIGPPGVQIVEVKHWTETWVKRNFAVVEREAEHMSAGGALDGLNAALERLDDCVASGRVTALLAAAKTRALVWSSRVRCLYTAP